jgi:hypothetical protein
VKIFEAALVGIPSLNITILYNGANAFQAGFVFLAAVLTATRLIVSVPRSYSPSLVRR